MPPNSPYAASKAASDHLVRAYHKTYGLQTTISNCSNNYGPFQFIEKLIPLMITNILAGKPIPVYGDGCQIRDWLYVNDHNRGIHPDNLISHVTDRAGHDRRYAIDAAKIMTTLGYAPQTGFDQDKFKALDWGLRTWDQWQFNDCDDRFGSDWPLTDKPDLIFFEPPTR